MALGRIDVKIEVIAALFIIVAAWSLKKPKGVKIEKDNPAHH